MITYKMVGKLVDGGILGRSGINTWRAYGSLLECVFKT